MTGYSRLEYCSDLAVGSTIIAYKVVGKYSMVAANAVGTHDELIKSNKIYQEVYYSQNRVGGKK